MSSLAPHWLLFGLFWPLSAGCGSPDPDPGGDCETAEACGSAGDSVCVDGTCQFFDQQTGHGNAVVDLSFQRDMYAVAASGYVSFFHRQTADGQDIDCEGILGGWINLEAKTLNLLQASPKYLEFDWRDGATFFPGNLVQFVRPAENILAVAEGYERKQGDGIRTALGCKEGETIIKDQKAEMVIQLVRP